MNRSQECYKQGNYHQNFKTLRLNGQGSESEPSPGGIILDLRNNKMITIKVSQISMKYRI